MLLFKINLQIFNGEKTEKATPKRRKEAREKGQVLQSREINSAFILLFTFLGLRLIGAYIYRNIIAFSKDIFINIVDIDSLFTINGIYRLFILMVLVFSKIVLPILMIAFIIGLFCSYVQVGFLFTSKTLTFKLDRINPINGFKKIVSKRSLVEFFKSLIKIGVVGYVLFSYIVKQSKNIMNILDMELYDILFYLGKMTMNIAFRASFILILLAIIDYYYQKRAYDNELKMSKQEIKEEYKQTEGNPQIKSKIKEKQRQISMKRMMQDVPKADVIITNPTHYAVAIRYDGSIEDAPIVLAKGKNLIAQNIKKIALESKIPMVENRVLARTIYSTVDIGNYIPPDLYQAVAEVLAYVYKMKNMN